MPAGIPDPPEPRAAGGPSPGGGRGPRRRLYSWFAGFVAVLILAGATASYLRERPAAAPAAPAGAREDIPPALRPYYDRATAGDTSAMRMLGTMYYNGLNVPQNPREGIRWYRKAAAAGSVAARKDLEQLGAAPEKP
jgi:hypothetical protein